MFMSLSMSDAIVLGYVALAVLAVGSLAYVMFFRKPKEKAPPPPPPVAFKVSVYNDGEVVHNIRAIHASVYEGAGYATAEGATQNQFFGGCFVIEPIDSPAAAPQTANSKFKVTLFDGGKKIREWYCIHASSYKGTGYFTTEGATVNTMVAGSFLIEPL